MNEIKHINFELACSTRNLHLHNQEPRLKGLAAQLQGISIEDFFLATKKKKKCSIGLVHCNEIKEIMHLGMAFDGE